MPDDYLDLLIRAGLCGLAAAGLWYAFRPRYVFTLRIADGDVQAAKGMAPRRFVQEVEAVCREAGVRQGQVHGVRRGRSIVVAFSGPIPEQCRQQLRNLWQLHGSLR